jgi:hypothetical protein
MRGPQRICGELEEVCVISYDEICEK